MNRRYEFYHFGIQLALFFVGVLGWFLRRYDLVPWMPHRIYIAIAICFLLIASRWRRWAGTSDSTPIESGGMGGCLTNGASHLFAN